MTLRPISELLPDALERLQQRTALVPMVLERLKRAGFEIKGDGTMPEFKLRRVNDSIGYDLGIDENNNRKGLFYNGKPIKVDINVLLRSEIVGHASVTTDLLNQMYDEFDEGGECQTCGADCRKLRLVEGELRNKMAFGVVLDDSTLEDDDQVRICIDCWSEQRSEIKKRTGEDIGPFDENDKHEECVHCHNFIPEHLQLHDENYMICDTCAQVMSDLAG